LQLLLLRCFAQRSSALLLMSFCSFSIASLRAFHRASSAAFSSAAALIASSRGPLAH
jgi:hypothetical protein